MKVHCKREKIREAFSIVGNAIPSKSTKPILQSVRVEAKKGRLELSSTDLEIAVRYWVDEVQIDKEGVVVLSSKAGDFIRDLADESVSLIADGANCKIRGLSDECTLVGQNPEEFPKIPEFEEKTAFQVSSEDFSSLFRKTSFAAAKEMGRYAMNGLLLETSPEVLRAVATDGRRLALCEKVISKGPKSSSAIVPIKAVSQFLRVLESGEKTVSLSLTGTQVAIKTEKAQVFARLLEGEFPRYSAVIPKECPFSAEADREKLLQKLQLVANLTADESRSVRWSFTPSSIRFAAASAGRGEAKAELEASVKAKSGGDLQLSFNPDYVLEGLKSSDAETVRLEFSERDKPGKFILGENYVYVVMPITLE